MRVAADPPIPVGHIIEAVNRFIEENIGEVVQVFHEIDSSDGTHIDIHHGRSSGDVRYQWLFTSGMSSFPMAVPEGWEDMARAEILICLPPDWPLNMDAFKDENNYWPLRLLKMLARYPRRNSTWLCAGHSVAEDKAFAPATKMSSVVLMRPQLLSVEPVISVCDQRVCVWAAYPLYEEELAYKLKHGFEALADLLVQNGVTERLNPARPSIVKQV